MTRSKRPPPLPPPKPPRRAVPRPPVLPPSALERPPEDLDVVLVTDSVLPPAKPRSRFPAAEVPTGKRNPAVPALNQLIGVFDELDPGNRTLLVRIAHELLAAQQRRRNG